MTVLMQDCITRVLIVVDSGRTVLAVLLVKLGSLFGTIILVGVEEVGSDFLFCERYLPNAFGHWRVYMLYLY